MSMQPHENPHRWVNGRWHGEKTGVAGDPWPYAKQTGDAKVDAVVGVLEDWFWSIENGTAHLRAPDPRYVRPADKPAWTEADLTRIIAAIEQEYFKEIGDGAAWAGRLGCTAGPGLDRLALPQRLALVQQLEQVFLKFPPEPKPYVPPYATWPTAMGWWANMPGAAAAQEPVQGQEEPLA